MPEQDNSHNDNLSSANRVQRSIAARRQAYLQQFPAADGNGKPIPAEVWAKRKIYNGSKYIGTADELGID